MKQTVLLNEVIMNLDYLKKNKTSLAVAVMAAYLSYMTLSQYWVHLSLAYGAFQNLRNMPQEHIDDFFAAYKHLETMPVGMPRADDYKAVHDYYRVLNVILTAGVVMEIMLVPPVIDRKQGILANLDLWQRRMTDRLLVKSGDRLLDTGCGRGLIAMNVATWYNTSVVGVNIDETQIAHAKRLAYDAHMEKTLQFVQQDYNLPFDFLPDESIDGHYCAQACMFVTNKTSFMQHSARVLKKGARFYGLEYIQLPKYDESDPAHVDLVQRSSTILGTSMPGPISAWTDALKAAGFRILYAGHPTPKNSMELLEDINDIYAPLQYAVSALGKVGLMSTRLVDLFERLRRDWDALVTMMNMELATPTYEFVAEKM